MRGFEDDDEVAVIHAPAAAGGAALSDAMVDLRASLDAAEVAGVIDHRDRKVAGCGDEIAALPCAELCPIGSGSSRRRWVKRRRRG